jgi:hypothetical protein
LHAAGHEGLAFGERSYDAHGNTEVGMPEEMPSRSEAARIRRRLAFEEQMRHVQADPDASARGRRIAQAAAAYLKHRRAVRASEAAR